jgi:hypothetical protein
MKDGFAGPTAGLIFATHNLLEVFRYKPPSDGQTRSGLTWNSQRYSGLTMRGPGHRLFRGRR